MLTMPKFQFLCSGLTLLLAVPFAPQAIAKTPVAATALQPEIASGSAMIVDLASKRLFTRASRIWFAPSHRLPK